LLCRFVFETDNDREWSVEVCHWLPGAGQCNKEWQRFAEDRLRTRTISVRSDSGVNKRP
jgi:hypothetical protein